MYAGLCAAGIYVLLVQCFMDQWVLNGKQAAWASKKYWGHRDLPDSIMQ